MEEITKPKILVLAGPTASGKTNLSIHLAKELNAEIINFDSVQFYKDFNIGTAKPSSVEREEVPHHLIDFADPRNPLDVVQFSKLADDKIKEVISRGKLPLLVGGGGLYLKALLHGVIPTEFDLSLRKKLENRDLEDLYAELKKLDQKSASKIHPNDKFRIIRALEIAYLSGDKTSVIRDQHSFLDEKYQAIILVLAWERKKLHQRIEKRTKDMLGAGLVQETKDLLKSYSKDLKIFNSIGYAQVLEGLEADLSSEEVTEKIIIATRRLAKQQFTYFRNEPAKRNWELRPNQADPNIEINSDSASQKSGLLPLKVCSWNCNELLKQINCDNRVSETKIRVWFLDADELNF